MVLLPENGYSSGTYKVSFSAPIVAVIPLLSGYGGSSFSSLSCSSWFAGGKWYDSYRLKQIQRFCF